VQVIVERLMLPAPAITHLIGIHHLDQLRHFNLDPSQGRNLFTGPIFNLVDDAVALRQKIEGMPSNTVEDVEAQEKLLAEAEEKTARLRCAADLLLSVEFQGASAADKQSLHDSMAIQAGHYVENGTIEEFRQAVRKALKGQQTFHLLFVAVSAAAALTYLGWRAWRTWAGRSSGCGGGCGSGCANPPSRDVRRSPLVSSDELTARLRHRRS
jgi:hypothetical protein